MRKLNATNNIYQENKKSLQKDFFDNSNFYFLLYNDRLKRIIVVHFAKICVYKK